MCSQHVPAMAPTKTLPGELSLALYLVGMRVGKRQYIHVHHGAVGIFQQNFEKLPHEGSTEQVFSFLDQEIPVMCDEIKHWKVILLI